MTAPCEYCRHLRATIQGQRETIRARNLAVAAQSSRIAELERLAAQLAEHLAAASEALGVLAERPSRDPFRFSRCHACVTESAGIFWLPAGCAAFPDVRLQPLCLAHIVKAAPLGGMFLLVNRLAAGSDPLPGFGEGSLPQPGSLTAAMDALYDAGGSGWCDVADPAKLLGRSELDGDPTE